MSKKRVITLISVILLAAAAVAAFFIWQDEIIDFFYSVKERLFGKRSRFTPEECEDFADI